MGKSRTVAITLSLLGMILITCSIFLQKEESQTYQEAITTCNNLYNSNNLPKEELTKKELNICKEKIEQIKNNSNKQELKVKTQQVENYLNLEAEINSYLENGITSIDQVKKR